MYLPSFHIVWLHKYLRAIQSTSKLTSQSSNRKAKNGFGYLGGPKVGQCPRYASFVAGYMRYSIFMSIQIANDIYFHKLGTVVLVKDASQTQDGPIQIDTRLKYDLSGPNPVLHVPQPSDDPNDPLVSDTLLVQIEK